MLDMSFESSFSAKVKFVLKFYLLDNFQAKLKLKTQIT